MGIPQTLFVLALLLHLGCQQPLQHPVIGIYTQDAEDFASLGSVDPFATYIAASYVKNLEMAGAQVIPLFYHYSQAQLESILGKINGVFFPGGQMPIDWSTDWTKKTSFIFEYAKKQNKAGNVYPIWATCLGYETIMYITSGQTDNTTVFTEVFGQDGLSCPLIVKNHDSKLLRSLSNPEYTDAVNNDGIFYFHHRWSVMQSTFNRNSNWMSFWNLISTSKTNYGAEFLSTLEAKQYPFFLTQYHPEKNSYEWRVPAKRTYNSISSEQKFINVFVNQARKNKNQFPASELSKKIIYNFHPVYLYLGRSAQFGASVIPNFISRQSKFFSYQTSAAQYRSLGASNQVIELFIENFHALGVKFGAIEDPNWTDRPKYKYNSRS